MTEGLEARSLSFALEDDAPLAAGPAGVVSTRNSQDGRLLSTPPYAIHNAHGPVSNAPATPSSSSWP
jgi:hypothetical protein